MNQLKINIEISIWYNTIKSKLGQNKNEVLTEKLNMQSAFIWSFAWYQETEWSRMLTDWICSIVF
jgi:hypothetical protein